MEAANQAAAAPKTEQTAGKEQSMEVEQGGATAIFRSLALGGGSGGNKPKPTITPGNILQLQRVVGNQAVQRLLQRQMAQKTVERVLAPASPQAPIVARDDDYNNVANLPVTEEEEEVFEEEEEDFDAEEEVAETEEELPDDYQNGAIQQQVIQVTDLEVLDSIADNAPLPESANEVEGPQAQPPAEQQAPQQSAPPPTFNKAEPIGRRKTRMKMGNQRPNFTEGKVPNNDPGGSGLLGGHRAASNEPKTYTEAAPLQYEEKGEDKGLGMGAKRRRRGLIKTHKNVRTRYLNKVERRAYRITIEGGVFKNVLGQPLDSSGAQGFTRGNVSGLIFVMSQRGKMYAADMVAEYDAGGFDAANKVVKPGTNEVLAFHHSSFKAGKAVAGAGEIVVKAGKLEMMTDASGHYRPDARQTLQVMKHFMSLGVDLTQVRFKTSRGMTDITNGVIAADYLALDGDYRAAYQAERQRLNPQPQQIPQPQPQQQAPQPQQPSQADEEPGEYNS